MTLVFVSGDSARKTTTNTCRNFSRARELSGLLREAFPGDDEAPAKTTLEPRELEIPEKYNLAVIARFLETGELVSVTVDDIPAILNAANYWDIPVLLRMCREFVVEVAAAAHHHHHPLQLLPSLDPTNANSSKRRQFIDLIHRQ